MPHTGSIHTSDYLKRIGVPDIAAATSPFDPGYDPSTLGSHLQQSSHLMSMLKISMACWMVANESATRTKIALARAHGVPTVTGGGPFEIAVAQGELPAYLDLCADVGVTRIECGQGFTESDLNPKRLSPPQRVAASMFRWNLGRSTTEVSTTGRSLRGLTRGRNGSMRARSNSLSKPEKAQRESDCSIRMDT